MKNDNRIRAVSLEKSIIRLVTLGAIVLIALRPGMDGARRILLGFCALVLLPGMLDALVNGVYFTEKGVECFRFGKLVRSLSWREIAMICRVKDLRFLPKTTAATHLLLIPGGCQAFDRKKMSGLGYRLRYWNRAVWVDDTQRNAKWIGVFYGKILEMRMEEKQPGK